VSTIHDEASKVTVALGVVRITGPDDVDISMTPQAAAETSVRLSAGASQAMRQLIAARPDAVRANRPAQEGQWPALMTTRVLPRPGPKNIAQQGWGGPRDPRVAL
jgi:hypothetical protein